MPILVDFLMINSTRPLGDLFNYVENIINELKQRGLITQTVILAPVDNAFGTSSPMIDIEDSVFITEFAYTDNSQNTKWQITFEFGTFSSCTQVQIQISSEDYVLSVDNKYLEQLKLTIKNIVKSDWEKPLWLVDKDSEILSIALYPDIYRAENLARQLINEIMTKEYGTGWWNLFVPLLIKNKHKSRLGGYKSITPGFANVDERLMSIDIGDLNSIFTLKVKKWDPVFNSEINSFLNDNIIISPDKLKIILSEQLAVSKDLWAEQFSKYLSEKFLDKFKVFEQNRNHVVHNKLIDRTAYNSISNSIQDVESELKSALQTAGRIVISTEQREIITRQTEIEQEESQIALHEIMESEAGVNVRNADEIIELFDECLEEFHSEFQKNLRFRSDIEISDYQNIASDASSGSLFEIKYKMDHRILKVDFTLDILDDSQGVESSLRILLSGDHENKTFLVRYMNGEISYNSYQGCYMPETQDEIYTSDIEKLTDGLSEYLDDQFENIREKVDSDMYSIMKDGGNSPVADIPCCECGDEYICVDESYGDFGQCLNCGEHNDIYICDRCGCYFEATGNESDDDPNFCENCLDYFEKQ